jgi:hypothetical protein
VRQRFVVILNPTEIAGIKSSAALIAFDRVFGVAQWPPGDLVTDDDAARARFVKAGDLHLMFRSKKSGPGFPRPDLIRRRVHRTVRPFQFILPRRTPMSNYRQQRRWISSARRQ